MGLVIRLTIVLRTRVWERDNTLVKLILRHSRDPKTNKQRERSVEAARKRLFTLSPHLEDSSSASYSVRSLASSLSQRPGETTVTYLEKFYHKLAYVLPAEDVLQTRWRRYSTAAGVGHGFRGRRNPAAGWEMDPFPKVRMGTITFVEWSPSLLLTLYHPSLLLTLYPP